MTAGKLELDNAANGGLASGLLTISGGTIEALNAGRTLSNAVTLNGNMTVAGTQDLTFNGNFTQTAGSRTITNNTTSGNVRYDNLALSGNATAYNLTLAGAGNTVIGNLTNSLANNTLTNNQSSLVTIDSNVYLSESAIGRTLTLPVMVHDRFREHRQRCWWRGNASNLTVTNTNLTTLSGSNSYSGLTTMNAAAGTLRLSVPIALPEHDVDCW